MEKLQVTSKIDLLMKSFAKAKKCDFKKSCSFPKDISDGGLAIALAESCILSTRGATIELEKNLNRVDNLLFAEGQELFFQLVK